MTQQCVPETMAAVLMKDLTFFGCTFQEEIVPFCIALVRTILQNLLYPIAIKF